ncbi:Ank-repeat protein mbp1 [Colletotrichum higginsianum IMI 349063]|uniref:Ank-repeat protein mbp1 n=1 Tax=Colletotrichum higginsianum (strain IMI 349063) TaxID=759273 RepID=A0A1B7XQN4_COLHI|nr:Ank-repeat protein mbp1 [Colletotrichum higginsianum IMI 349063]OBR02075.1 Ank-repeat protein mbp1 [Colletotrichum higginsianum IMI 349063]
MLLPDQLLGIYGQYKQDTDSVAPKSGRLKGKDRIKARGDGRAKKGPTPVEKKTTRYVVAIKDFLPLANFVADCRDPAVSVPDAFFTTIDRLIDLRSGFRRRLSDYGLEPDDKSDERHQYFVAVLKAVREALRPRAAAATVPTEADNAADTGRTAPKESSDDLSNRFAALSVEEPSQAFLDAFRNAPHARPEPRGKDPVSYEAEPQTSLEDVFFAFTVLVNDLSRIRSRIEWIWSEHRNGIFDLAAAAVATNTAISVARGWIEDISPLLGAQDGGLEGILNTFYFMACRRNGFAVEQVYLADSRDNFNYDTYDVADGCYVVAFRLLQGFAAVLNPRDLPIIKEGMFGKYNPNSDRASKTGREKFQEDTILLMEFFTELITVVRLIPGYPVEDEFLREMRRFDKTPVISLSLVFTAQVFLDIHHTMRAATRRSFEAMVKETSVMDNSLGSHLEFHKHLKINNWPASNDHALRELSRLIQWMAKDPVHGAKARVSIGLGMPVPPEMEVHRIMIYSPLLSGLFLFRLRTEMYDIGLAVANAWGSVTYTAHLRPVA